MSSLTPNRADPTRMPSIRMRLYVEVRKGFASLKTRIRHVIVTLDVLGLRFSGRDIGGVLNAREGEADEVIRKVVSLVVNEWARAWAYETNPNKVKRFREWLRTQMVSTLPGDALLEKYISLGYEHGLERGIKDARRQARKITDPEERKTYLKGAREELRGRLDRSNVTLGKVKLLAGRTYSEIEGMTSRLATKLSRVLVDGLVTGKTPEEIAKGITDETDLEMHRALTIVRTELTRAHAEGTLDALEEAGITTVGMEVEWVADGPNVCPKCTANEGKVFTLDEARGMIPLHPNCVVGDSVIIADDVLAVMKTYYTGEVLEITTAKGRRLTVTPNHVLLTKFGFVSARFAHKGLEVVDATSPGLGGNTSTPDDHADEPSIADVFAAFSKDPLMLTKSMPVTPENLHGDGAACDAKIDVVWPDGELRNRIDTGVTQEGVKLPFPHFQFADVESALTATGSLAQLMERVDLASDGVVGVSRDSLALLNGSLLHAKYRSLLDATEDHTGLNQSGIDGPTTASILLGEGEDAHTLREVFDDLDGGEDETVVFDTVVDVTRHSVTSLAVYDVQTRSTLYRVNGLITSNCNCAWLAVGET